MRMCDACGKTHSKRNGGRPATICRTCLPDVMAEVERLRSGRQMTDALTIARQIFRETHSAGAYLLGTSRRSYGPPLSHKAVDEGLNLRELILRRPCRSILRPDEARSAG